MRDLRHQAARVAARGIQRALRQAHCRVRSFLGRLHLLLFLRWRRPPHFSRDVLVRQEPQERRRVGEHWRPARFRVGYDVLGHHGEGLFGRVDQLY